MNYKKESPLEIDQDTHHLNIMSNGMLNGISDQDLINARLQYYGKSYSKKIPRNWIKNTELK